MPNISVDGGELISILKSMRDVLSKSSDAELKTAKLDKTPKTGENQANMAITGGKAVGAPGTNVVVKSVQEDAPGASAGGEQTEELYGKENSMLNAAAVPEEPKSLADALEDEDENGEKSEKSEKDEDEDNNDMPIEKAFPAGHPDGCFCDECKAARSEKEGMGAAEIKSLFKDIRKALDDASNLRKELNIMKSNMSIDIKKSTDKQVAVQLRKMGIVPTQAPIRRLELGADQYADLRKSQEDLEASKNLSGKPEQIVADLSKKSWGDLAKLREDSGDLVKFKGWLPSNDMYKGTGK